MAKRSTTTRGGERSLAEVLLESRIRLAFEKDPDAKLVDPEDVLAGRPDLACEIVEWLADSSPKIPSMWIAVMDDDRRDKRGGRRIVICMCVTDKLIEETVKVRFINPQIPHEVMKGLLDAMHTTLVQLCRVAHHSLE